VAIVGSQGFIEAAIVEGRADERLSARLGTPVAIDPEAFRSLHSEGRSEPTASFPSTDRKCFP